MRTFSIVWGPYRELSCSNSNEITELLDFFLIKCGPFTSIGISS